MLSILEKRSEIDRAQRALNTLLSKAASQRGRHLVGFPSGSLAAPVKYIGSMDLWHAYKCLDNRHWNSFGEGAIFNLPDTIGPAPAVEINPPTSGIHRAIAGAFATDDRGRIYLIHRGKVGGGAPGVGKTNFLAWYTGRLEGRGIVNLHGGSLLNVRDGDHVTPVIMVGQLDAPRFLDSLAELVRCSAEFRTLMKAGKLKTRASGNGRDNDLDTNEPIDRRGYKINRHVQASRDHGLIVNELLRQLRRDGTDARRTPLIDVYVRGRSGTMTHLFEVKTACNTGSLYQALGQLEWHGRNKAKRLIAVLPAEVRSAHRIRMEALGIRVVGYSWSGTSPRFRGILEALS